MSFRGGSDFMLIEDAGVQTGCRVVEVPLTDTFRFAGASPCSSRAA